MEAHERRVLSEGWEWKRLGDVVDILDGKRIPIKEDEREKRITGKPVPGLIPYYGATGQVGWIDDYIFDEELVLLGEDGAPFFDTMKNKAYIINGKSWVNNHAHVLKAKSGVALNLFICNYLNIFEYNGYVSGTTRTKLIQSEMRRIPIPLPPLPTQRRIVSILEKAEETKRLRAQADELTDRLLKSLFFDIFGDPVKNPKGWDVKKIDDIIISIEAGWSVNGEQRPLKEDELGVLKVSAVTKGVFLSSEYKAISKSQILKKVINPEKGDLLFSRANTRELVGATCLIDKNYPNLLLPDKLWKIKPDKKQLISEYFKFILSNPAIRKIISNNATGTSGSMFNISMNKLKSISIPIPPLPLQQKFARFVEKIEAMRQSQNQSKQQIEDLFGTLMQKAFRGEI